MLTPKTVIYPSSQSSAEILVVLEDAYHRLVNRTITDERLGERYRENGAAVVLAIKTRREAVDTEERKHAAAVKRNPKTTRKAVDVAIKAIEAQHSTEMAQLDLARKSIDAEAFAVVEKQEQKTQEADTPVPSTNVSEN